MCGNTSREREREKERERERAIKEENHGEREGAHVTGIE